MNFIGKKVFGWSVLGILNFLIFQWFFVRLARIVELDKDGKPTDKIVKLQWLKKIVPLTGWSFTPWKQYKYFPTN